LNHPAQQNLEDLEVLEDQLLQAFLENPQVLEDQ
jgi:hypothetical protein